MTASALVDKLRARGVELITDGSRLGVRPAGALTEEERAALRQHKAEVLALLGRAEAVSMSLPAMVAAYREVLSRLWLLNISPSSPVDRDEAHRLLATQARLCDELGPEFAAAVGRQHARTWAHLLGRCPWCGESGMFHDPDTGEEIALP
jgi:hypothetical protein